MLDAEEVLHQDAVVLQLIKHILAMSDEQQVALLKQLTSDTTFAGSEREETRRNYVNDVRFVCRNKTYTGMSEDISGSGMFIETRGPFRVGQTVVVSIPYSTAAREIDVPAEIVRTTPRGIGLRFIKRISG